MVHSEFHLTVDRLAQTCTKLRTSDHTHTPDVCHCVQPLTLQPDSFPTDLVLSELKRGGVDPVVIGNPLFQPIIPTNCADWRERSALCVCVCVCVAHMHVHICCMKEGKEERERDQQNFNLPSPAKWGWFKGGPIGQTYHMDRWWYHDDYRERK